MNANFSTPDTSHDEELARVMQLEFDRQSAAAAAAAAGATTTPGRPAPRMSGTYVEMPPEELDGNGSNSNMVTIDFAPQLEISEDEARGAGQGVRPVANPELLFEKMTYLIKTITLASGFYWVYSVIFRAWWFVLTMGALLCPVGYLGVKSTNVRQIFAFFVFLAVDSVFQLGFPFVYGYEFSLTGVVVSLTLAVMECMAAYYTFKYCEMIKLRESGASLDAMSDIL